MGDVSQLRYFQKPQEEGEAGGWEELGKSSQVYEAKGSHFYNSVLGSGIIFDKIIFLELEQRRSLLCCSLIVQGHYNEHNKVIEKVIFHPTPSFPISPCAVTSKQKMSIRVGFFSLLSTVYFFCIIKTMLYYFILIYEKNGLYVAFTSKVEAIISWGYLCIKQTGHFGREEKWVGIMIEFWCA